MPTRTLTEFSGTLIRMAAKAEAEARRALPKELTQVKAAPSPSEPEVTAQPTAGHPHGAGDQPHREPDVEGGPGEQSETAAFESATEAGDEAAAVEKAAEGEAAAVEKAAEGEAEEEKAAPAGETVPAQETDAIKAILDEAVGKATGTREDRLLRLREALRAVGGKAERVRLVRVFSGEEAIPGATRIGDHQYTVDLMPHSMKQVFKDPKEEKGRRGPRKPGGGGKAKQGESLEGSFSMESLAQDRKNERGPGGGGRGRPGGGRGGQPGGGRPGGGRPGGGRPGGGAGRAGR